VECTVELLEPAAAGDAALVQQLTDLINDVYGVAEAGLWPDGRERTTAPELAGEIRAGEIAVASREGRTVGAVRVYDVSEDTSGFGILVAAPDERGTGVGRALIEFAERFSRERGRRAIQLELLVPREWTHPVKEFLEGWYGRRGYALIGHRDFDQAYPQAAPMLATPCDLQVREKPLQ
jgi:GNAT superfamily N-acetyltransferase